MPVEVLALILLLACGEFDEEPLSFIMARLAFGRVCALWNDVVCRDARFWSSVFIGDPRTLAVLPLWLSRSKSSQLHLFVDTGTYAVNWRSFDTVFASLVQLVPSILGRITRFSLWDDYGDRGAVILHWLSRLAASNVQRLDIYAMIPTVADARVVERGRGRWGRSGDLSKPSTPLHLIPSASIVSLVVQRAFLVLHPSMLSGLRHLRLGPIPSHHRLKWDSLRSMLLSCPVLALFVCDDVRCDYGSFQECELLSVTHFRLVCRSYSSENIFTALRLPSLRVLSLDGYTPRLSYGAMTSALASVEVLAITCDLIWPCTLFHFLHAFVQLRTLDLRQMPEASRLAFFSIKQFMESYLEIKNLGRPKDTQPEILCPSLALVHFGATLTASEAAQLLSPTPPAIFSPNCVLSYVSSMVLTAADVDHVGGSFRVVEGGTGDHRLCFASRVVFRVW
ncbi:hypothetical protein R3P38DRAFT_2801374 [Favolaschia claudopus]|uniref:F-box domain-containing protein n=1 Tax=Favolaschia claudopus TaxID=2862362 RepID=A0AAV9ZVZ8_9AGAR